MDSVKIIEIKKSVFEDNDRAAEALRGELLRSQGRALVSACRWNRDNKKPASSAGLYISSVCTGLFSGGL